MNLENTHLGKAANYDSSYNPNILLPIPRASQRQEIGINSSLPFAGFDIWNHYEVSWLNERGKPIVALAEIILDCTSPNIIESKSMKLYFNSFNNTKIKDIHTLEKIIKNDLEQKVFSSVDIKIIPLSEVKKIQFVPQFDGICLDELDVDCDKYFVDPSYIKTENEIVSEVLYSNLLKSNCLVTNQPDWASIQINYRGKKISRQDLLRYIISFRNHNEFHEHCVERIFMDIINYAKPEELTVYARYTRRGGLDINPYRSTNKNYLLSNIRLCRQ